MQKNEPVSWCIVHCLVFWFLWEGRVFAVIRSKWHRIRDQGRSSLHIRACTALARQCFDARTHACIKHTHTRSVKHSNTHTNIQTSTHKHTKTHTNRDTQTHTSRPTQITTDESEKGEVARSFALKWYMHVHQVHWTVLQIKPLKGFLHFHILQHCLACWAIQASW